MLFVQIPIILKKNNYGQINIVEQTMEFLIPVCLNLKMMDQQFVLFILRSICAHDKINNFRDFGIFFSYTKTFSIF